jgi:hypothetical protein
MLTNMPMNQMSQGSNHYKLLGWQNNIELLIAEYLLQRLIPKLLGLSNLKAIRVRSLLRQLSFV